MCFVVFFRSLRPWGVTKNPTNSQPSRAGRILLFWTDIEAQVFKQEALYGVEDILCFLPPAKMMKSSMYRT